MHSSEQFDKLISVLERIAVAIESSKKDAGTPFPWGDSRVPQRIRSIDNWQIDRPETFEALIKIGRSTISRTYNSVTSDVGKMSASKLDPIFEENGFGDQWQNS